MTPDVSSRPLRGWLAVCLAAALPAVAAPGLSTGEVITYHEDGRRTGWNDHEAVLTPATVTAARFGIVQTLAVDGKVLAQPLVVSAFAMPDGRTRDVLVVATEHNSVYAFDAANGELLWQTNLGPSQPTSALGCSHVSPEYGISATPVILRAARGEATIYVVTATMPAEGDFRTQIRALDLADGHQRHAPKAIAASATRSDGSTIVFDPRWHWARAGLAYGSESIYVTMSSHCDKNSDNITGWVMRYSPLLTQLNAFETVGDPAGYELSAIWMSGFAPAVDGGGNVFVVTGNGASNLRKGGRNYGESVLRLKPDLSEVADSFTPADYRRLNNFDSDFGAGGVMLLPPAGSADPLLAVAMGKDGKLYLLDRERLGGVQDGDAGALQVTTTDHGVWGGPAYYGGTGAARVYYQGDADVLRAYAVSSAPAPALSLVAQGTVKAGFGGSFPVVSSNGDMPGTGVVWLVHRGSTIRLEAYDALALGAPLVAVDAGAWTGSAAFVSPTVSNGRVYVGADGTVTVFGLVADTQKR